MKLALLLNLLLNHLHKLIHHRDLISKTKVCITRYGTSNFTIKAFDMDSSLQQRNTNDSAWIPWMINTMPSNVKEAIIGKKKKKAIRNWADPPGISVRCNPVVSPAYLKDCRPGRPVLYRPILYQPDPTDRSWTLVSNIQFNRYYRLLRMWRCLR